MKNNRLVAILSAAVITIGAIGSVAFARNIKDDSIAGNKSTIMELKTIKTNKVVEEGKDLKENSADENTNYNRNSTNNPSKDIYKDMIKIMRNNGYEDAARYMQTGDYDAMTDYMNSISQEDYDKMIEIMNSNGYGYMGKMMESIGREGMIQMHNSMRVMHGSNSMMGGY